MTAKQVIHNPSQSIIVRELKFADNFFKRLKGLMFTASLPAGSGLIITPCQQIHTQFMKFSVDVMFVDADDIVLHIERNMQPWSFSKFYKQAKYVLEVNAGEAEKVNVGDKLTVHAL